MSADSQSEGFYEWPIFDSRFMKFVFRISVEILVDDSDNAGPSSMVVRIEFVFFLLLLIYFGLAYDM